jgi:DNA gyrase subunit A
VEEFTEEEAVENYPVTLFVSREGYFKKITPQSLRMSSEQKYKENDGPARSWEATNRSEILVFTDRQQCYKAKVSDFDDTKASALGTYLPSHLGFDEGETVVDTLLPGDYSAHVLLFYANGKVARVPLESFVTKTNRKRLTGSASDKSPLVCVLPLNGETEIALYTSESRAVVFHTGLLQPKAARNTQGVAVARMKPKFNVVDAKFVAETDIKNLARYRVRSIPALGALLKEEDQGHEQLSLLEEND